MLPPPNHDSASWQRAECALCLFILSQLLSQFWSPHLFLPKLSLTQYETPSATHILD